MPKTAHPLAYSLSLSFNLVATFIQLAWIKTPYMARLTIIICLLSVITTGIVVQTLPAQSATKIITTSPPLSSEKVTILELSKSELLARKQQYETLLQHQPHHRDILLNLALTHKALGDETKYQEYWDQAKQTDPNNEIFE